MTDASGPLWPDPALLTRHGLADPVLITRTGIASIWKADGPEGSAVALKVYPSVDMANEKPGFALLSLWAGCHAARLHGLDGNVAIMEWLDGPSLGDLVRSGRDEAATEILADVARKLHALSVTPDPSFPKLTDWFEGLFRLKLAPELPAPSAHAIETARETARSLLAEPIDARPLHGDLHHDNIRQTERGYCAFDAKGVIGERAYEFANAVRNPKGADALIRQPDVIRRRIRIWSDAFDLPPGRLLRWAAAKCALSIAWRHKDRALRADPELDLLEILVSLQGFDERT